MMFFQHDIAAYETWLRRRCDVVEKDLKEKHERMRKSAFKFLRDVLSLGRNDRGDLPGSRERAKRCLR
jgi:hypothetical protein